LNFLRLAPQSSRSILTGKLLGVPILLYLVSVLALPLHFVAGLLGQIPVTEVLAFYGVLAASCLLFYSAALLFGLVGTWLGGFQAWLGSGILLIFGYVMLMMVMGSNLATHTPLDWLNLFNPTILVPYLLNSYGLDAAQTSSLGGFRKLQMFHLPIGASFWSLVACMVLNYGLWTFWVWQGLKRCFHNPSATLLGKQQSYWLTACFEVVLLGFALNPQVSEWRPLSKGLFDNYQIVLVVNLLLFLGLIAALSPHRQAMQDWARYRHQKRSSRKGGVLADLVWGEKSPAILAVVLNLAIASASLLTWIVLWPASEYKILGIWGLLVTVTLISVYAIVAQLMLFMKTPKRAPLAATSVASLIVLPPIVFGMLTMTPTTNPAVWLFSAVPWIGLENVSGISVFLAAIGQSLMLGLLSLQLTRQLREAGESTTKALLSGRSSLALK
ncbi:MAG: ABC transporter permease, partial [Microcoleus sp. SIO2G3]|nr:ABC transporter permease [Microcoleus sp. SIO2G3]